MPFSLKKSRVGFGYSDAGVGYLLLYHPKIFGQADGTLNPADYINERQTSIDSTGELDR